jgi:hypothetical protein
VGQGDAKLDEEATCQLIDFVPTMLYKVPHELMELCMFAAAVMLCLPLFLLLLLHKCEADSEYPPFECKLIRTSCMVVHADNNYPLSWRSDPHA